jgi:multidrug efflux system membrane fusion protein
VTMQQYKKPILQAVSLRKPWPGRTAILAIAAVFVLFGLYWFSKGFEAQKPPASAPISVSVASVEREDIPNKISLVGTVYAYETVALKSRIDSQITKVAFKDGDLVKEGQILFELDKSIINAQLNQAEANLKRDEAQLENAQAQFERYRKLAKKGFASGEKMDEAEATFKTQTAAVNATKAMKDSIRAQLNFTIITAPITGRAGIINVTRGNTIKANDPGPLVTINRVKPIRVQFAIPQRYYDALREASQGAIQVTAQRSSDGTVICIGELEYIDNTINSTTGTFNARASFENEAEKLWPGMFVNVSIILGTDRDVLVIPQVAVQNSQDGTFVFAVDAANNKAVRKPVEVLRMQDNKAIIKAGLTAGESIVVDGLLKLSDGSTVEISAPATDGKSQK